MIAYLLALVGLASHYGPGDPGGFGGGEFVGCPAAAHRVAPGCCDGRTGRTGRWQGRCRLLCVREALAARGLAVVAMRPGDARCGERVTIQTFAGPASPVAGERRRKAARDEPGPSDAGCSRGDSSPRCSPGNLPAREAARGERAVEAIVLDCGPWMQVDARGRSHFYRRHPERLRRGNRWRGLADLDPATYRALGGTSPGRLLVRVIGGHNAQ